MKTYSLFTAILALGLLFAACDEEDEPDTRQALEGKYDMDDSEVRITQATPALDSTMAIDLDAKISLDVYDYLDKDELQLNLNVFVEKLIQNTLITVLGNAAIIVNVDIDERETVAEIQGEEFSLDEFDFRMPIMIEGGDLFLFNVQVELSGEVNGDEIEIEYDILMSRGTYSPLRLRGTSTGEKD
ncbi:hypothetical protein [Fulvivirga ligni]|uniref:hypothetical protein n=1 Tax=Fulvivirga ligni TaxID=2904246 RepID=UPI001F22F86E|nr:hypothetical protein [Fulvivirga ligni]UII21705.1 hypothetical protein LVD16_00440 [Fulvivirga ligni]